MGLLIKMTGEEDGDQPPSLSPLDASDALRFGAAPGEHRDIWQTVTLVTPEREFAKPLKKANCNETLISSWQVKNYETGVSMKPWGIIVLCCAGGGGTWPQTLF